MGSSGCEMRGRREAALPEDIRSMGRSGFTRRKRMSLQPENETK